MSTEAKRVVELWGFDGLGLILKLRSGVYYTSQVAGYACLHPEVEGVFHPLAVEPGKAEVYSLTQHFRGPWNHLSEADADFVDKVLRRNGHSYLSVDRANLAQSYEAWVHVLVREPSEGLSGFGDCEGVLIWPNSD